ncbi:MAG TPA: glucoamylase family protein [Candidatus Binatia bacterium]|nr:glucoamylase family protein [Candidatus Binatia bacterium]
MSESGNLQLVSAEADLLKSAAAADASPAPESPMRPRAIKLAGTLAWVPGQKTSTALRERSRLLYSAFRPIFAAFEKLPSSDASSDLRALREAKFLLRVELDELAGTFRKQLSVPQVRDRGGLVVPRILPLTEDFLAAGAFQFSGRQFTEYILAFQEVAVLKVAELWTLIPVLKLVLLEQIAERGQRLLRTSSDTGELDAIIQSLREIRQTSWKSLIEPLILFDRVLGQDPAGAYDKMDYDSRDLYRRRLVNIADHSDCSEMEVAQEVLALAREAAAHPNSDSRFTTRLSHVGTYLIGDGAEALERKVGFHPPFVQRLRAWLRNHPDEFYMPGIAALTFTIIAGVIFLLTSPATPLQYVLLATLLVLLPGSQSAVQIMNYLVTLLLPSQILPKLDFSEAIPPDCATLVAIPAMLLNEKQVRKLVDQIEVRFLGNQDPNLHFVLLTDMPDSPSRPDEDDELVGLCSDLIQRLSQKYADTGMASFFLLHRHRVYNPRERLWMGWERKRGKLMDLNNLLCGEFDSFPVKVGELKKLAGVRFVITLDADTELPRGSAKRMIGALAHPLNRAIIDSEKGVVVAGYGILQPRVGVGVQSSARSRLANIYSGQTGFDIYTHATSDVYQDLYGEGIFVGKGIYEVATVHKVLHQRFPRNSLLSHDLIEGSYARAGLVSDIDIIEDYPSHYSAHNRRKHRWLRGDWQITEWLFPRVPDESGREVANPLSVVSRWKIFDNLRRSLVEPAFFLLLLFGWIVLPGNPWAWTFAAVCVLFLPALVQLVVDLAHALVLRKSDMVSDAFDSFANAAIADWLTVTFMAHQALLSLDAVVRTMVRRMVTRQRLLQWETAAEAEMNGHKTTMLDIYLNWTPALALCLALLVWGTRSVSLLAALPILLLWACSKPISVWLNRPSRSLHREISQRDRIQLRLSALRTWRYFAEFNTEEHNWLIPDNVREQDLAIAGRISPTNLGLLLNSRQVACEFGYLTVPEFALLTQRTLATVSRLQKHRGHVLNWYDTGTLAPLSPAFVSSVDNANLVASLWTLQGGCLDLLDRPLLRRSLRDGFVDHLYLLASLRALPHRRFSAMKKILRRKEWLAYLLDIPESTLQQIRRPVSRRKYGAEAQWFQEQAEERIREVSRTVHMYAPWLLPEFSALKHIHPLSARGVLPALRQMPALIDELELLLKGAIESKDAQAPVELCEELLSLLPGARSRATALIADIRDIAAQTGALAEAMDFEFLVNRNRELLSIGFNTETKKLEPACYDLLASEARTAYFVAIAKDEIPQESWFLLGRPPVSYQGVVGLISWTGTMFEYLMPAMWMRIYPNSVLERAAYAAVRLQQEYAKSKRIPWGISESACFKTDPAGNYEYHAFGVPSLAIHKVDIDGPVVSPYSTFLALDIDPESALHNLRRLQRKGALGAYGFYDAVDFNRSRVPSPFRGYEPVRCWMAHHQGMSLLALANFLNEGVVQDWFHSHPRVQATELLLQEKPTASLRGRRSGAKAA